MKKYILIVAFVFMLPAILIWTLPPGFYFVLDMGCWNNWCIYMFRNGFSNAYDSGTNYPPFFLYFLYLFGLTQGSETAIKDNIALIKYVPLLFDFIPFVILFFLYKKNYFKDNVHYYLLFNIAYFYNSVAWGQVDSIHSNLSLLAFLAAFKSPVISIILFTIALNTKMQAIIFLPVLALVIFTQLKNFRQVACLLVSVIITEIIITLPFIFNGTFSGYINMYLTSVDNQPKISLNAFNLWYLILWDANPQKIYDRTTWFVFSYKQFGLAFFMTASFFSLLPLFLKSLIAFRQKAMPENYYSLLFLSAAMVTLSFFYFNTQMHERYIHPAIIFLFFYSAWSRKFGLYILVSIAYLLEMERVLQFCRMPVFVYDSILDKRYIAVLFSLAVVVGFRTLYVSFPIKNDLMSLKSLFNRTNNATILQ